MDPTTPVFNKALRYLSFRPRSEKEIRDYLLGKNKPKKRGVEPPCSVAIDLLSPIDISNDIYNKVFL